MKDIHNDCKWQTRDEMDKPTNPLQSITESYCGQSFDMAERKFDAWMYGVVVGWDDAAYKQLKVQHNWTDEQIAYQKEMHQNYIAVWDLWMEHQNKVK